MNKIASGRPLRFFVILMGGWTVIRLATAISGISYHTPPAASPRLASMHRLAERRPTEATSVQFSSDAPRWSPAIRSTAFGQNTAVARLLPRGSTAFAFGMAGGTLPPRPSGASAIEGCPTSASQGSCCHTARTNPTAAPAVPLALPNQPRVSRWHASGWAFWREGSATPTNVVTAGRLGGSQAGLRVDYDLTPDAAGRVAAYGRFTAAMNRPASPEAAVGFAWQPVRTVPISIAGERRIALGKGARNANALLVIGGFGPTPVATGLEAEAYAQAGMVGFRRHDLFVDGKFSLLAPITRSPLRLGASVSGGAQPGVERIDVGPELQIRLPLPRVNARLSVEWRERIAGEASPASGLTVTLGTDF